jgi:hypothetical protein
MEKLKENWLTEGLIDFEYKKYVLLAYLKSVKESFSRVELYPFSFRSRPKMKRKCIAIKSPFLTLVLMQRGQFTLIMC